jgi:hypothetical protein
VAVATDAFGDVLVATAPSVVYVYAVAAALPTFVERVRPARSNVLVVVTAPTPDGPLTVVRRALPAAS